MSVKSRIIDYHNECFVLTHTHARTHTQSWESAPDRYREKLLQLIGKIGKDDVQGKTATKVREGLNYY